MTSDAYYFLDESNQTKGPVNWETLEQMYYDGTITPNTHVGAEGASEWSTFPILSQTRQAESRPTPPPLPTSAQVATAEDSPTPISVPKSAAKSLLKYKGLMIGTGVFFLICIFLSSLEGNSPQQPQRPSGSNNQAQQASNYEAEQQMRGLVESLNATPIQCRQCSGSGKKILTGFCNGCRGQGTVRTPSGFVTACSKCGGSGQGVYPCDTCKGSGMTRSY